MQLVKFALVSLAFAFFIAACNDAGAPGPNANKPAPTTAPATVATPDEWADVAGTYQNFCVNCHKADGTGGSVTFEDGGQPLEVPTLKGEKEEKEPDEEYIEQITNGGDGMPRFKGRIKEDKIKQLVAYIRKEIQGKKDVKLPPASEEPAAKPAATPDKAGASPAKPGASPAKSPK